MQNRGRPGARPAAGPAIPPDVAPLLQQGSRLLLKGDVGSAAECAQAILTRHPNNADALHLMGLVALMTTQVDAAIDFFTRSLAGKPSDDAIRCNLANAFLKKGDTTSAEPHLRKVLKASPGNSAALSLFAESRALAGDLPEAKRLYERLFERLPDDPQAIVGYADLCVTLGDFSTARALYRKALALGTVSPLALGGLATFETFAKDSPEAVEISRLLESPNLLPNDHVILGYAAGRIAENAGDYDEAFSRFSKAKRYAGARFDIVAHRKTCATIRAIFTKAFFDERKGYGDQSTRPVFIVGMPRSGTTLTEQILARHPDAAGAGELPDIQRIATSLGFRATDATPLARRVGRLTQAETKTLARQYLASLDRISPGATRVVDKMPHNFQHLGLIALLFPNAKIIHCRRDPLDTCVSCFTTHLRANAHGYAGDLGTLGLFYREYCLLMDHWRSVLPLAIYELDYENLIAAPEEESRKLVDFVGLPWDPACLAPQESGQPIQSMSRLQVRQPIYRSSVGRWRRYEKYLGPLKAGLGDLARG
jgi:tetratricopeptide (TPR) repeat protein